MDLDGLRSFVAACETRSFRAAARRVAISPAAFTDRIQRLEDELGVALFQRTSRHVLPTIAGERLLDHARSLLEAADRVMAVAQGRDREPFSLTLGTRYELGLSWLCPGLSTLEAARPERRLHLRFGSAEPLCAEVRTGALDAMVSSHRLSGGGLSFELLHAEAYAFVAAPCGWRGPERATLLDVEPSLPLFKYVLDHHPPAARWAFAARQYLGGIGAIRLRVLEGKGVAVLPRYFVAADLVAGALEEPMPDLPIGSDTFRLIWREEHPKRGELRSLAEELRQLPLR